MQINVVKDSAGKVIGTFQTAAGNGPQAKPVAVAGLRIEQLEVAENYSAALSAIYK
jgi:hypothetical protein